MIAERFGKISFQLLQKELPTSCDMFAPMWQVLIIKIMFHTLQLFTYIFAVYTVMPYMFTL